MIRRYGAEPIRLDTTDLRRREIMHVGTSNKHIERKQYSLNTTVTLSVNSHEYDHLMAHAGEVGYYLYAQDKDSMFQFVWSRVTVDYPALHAIKDYYDLMGIEEDDHAVDTAERQWKRWKKETKKDRLSNTPQSVPSAITVLLSERQAVKLIERINNFIDEGCIEVDPRLRGAVALWVWCDLTSLTQREVASKMKLHQASVGRSVSRLRAALEYNSDLRKYVGYCLRTTHARPTPSIAS